MDISDLVKVSKDIYWLVNRGSNPDGISGDTLVFFQRFKKAYENKSSEQIRKIISDSYSGNLLEATNKEELIQIFKDRFDNLPQQCGLNLTIKILRVIESTNSLCRAVVEFDVKVTFCFFPIKLLNAGDVYLELRPDPPFEMFKILKMNEIKE
ncbi:MAG TPA: hypothetical protein DEF27_05835 [Oscillatoriales bacterium UBA8482]|nr:MAG: hypothetical protein AUK43_01595 [Oscillatoriales cyanobacterium CG2_30_40_61]HBW57336.1 hypothetical protein [Oscillatoriales bacterium UBA8482]